MSIIENQIRILLATYGTNVDEYTRYDRALLSKLYRLIEEDL